MKMICDVPDEVIKSVRDGTWLGSSVLEKMIAYGTPLPKGHGYIVDIETLIDMFWDGNSMEITKYDLSVIEPIIEADRGSEDE